MKSLEGARLYDCSPVRMKKNVMLRLAVHNHNLTRGAPAWQVSLLSILLAHLCVELERIECMCAPLLKGYLWWSRTVYFPYSWRLR